VSLAEAIEAEAPVRRFKPYPAYRDSGVEWLGQIPAHWGVKRLKWIAEFRGGGTPTKEIVEYWGGEIPWVSPKDMKVSIVANTEDKITPKGIRESATKLVPAGAVLLVVRSGILIHSIPVALAGCDVTLNQDLKAILPRPEIRSNYLCYLIRGMQSELLVEWKKEGATVESLELDLVEQTQIPLPSGKAQSAIAAFLDRETARIDALVAKKEALIALLQEKRTALITRAVTKGLDLNAAMKDSGVEWLGEIPAHWEVTRLKFLTPQISVGIVVTPAKYYEPSGVPCLRSLNVREDGLSMDDLVFISEESNRLLSKSQIYCDDLVAVRTGQPGTTAVVSKAFDSANCIDLIIIRKTKHFLSHFMSHYLNSASAKTQFLSGSDGAIQQHFNIETAGNLFVPIPPLQEQRQITSFIAGEAGRIGDLTGAVKNGIARLREFRTALISAAVTGKIDVREEVA
jgi:type I restriction enzyme, S subunit